MLALAATASKSTCRYLALSCRRTIISTAPLAAKQLPPRPKLDEDADITENFVKGTGPGGQKINKTASAVQLIHHPTGIVVKCQATRSRTQNRKIARAQLAERLELAEKGEESRVSQKAGLAKKKKASATKKSRRKYRKLAEDRVAAGSIIEDEESDRRIEEDNLDRPETDHIPRALNTAEPEQAQAAEMAREASQSSGAGAKP